VLNDPLRKLPEIPMKFTPLHSSRCSVAPSSSSMQRSLISAASRKYDRRDRPP
jgi:hypothetical protein